MTDPGKPDALTLARHGLTHWRARSDPSGRDLAVLAEAVIAGEEYAAECDTALDRAGRRAGEREAEITRLREAITAHQTTMRAEFFPQAPDFRLWAVLSEGTVTPNPEET